MTDAALVDAIIAREGSVYTNDPAAVDDLIAVLTKKAVPNGL